MWAKLYIGANTASYVRALLPRLARKAGIEKRVHPYGLRHTCAAELALEGVQVPLIQQQLGHASLRTTTVYLRSIAPVELVESMRRRSWTPSRDFSTPQVSRASSRRRREEISTSRPAFSMSSQLAYYPLRAAKAARMVKNNHYTSCHMKDHLASAELLRV